MQPSRMQLENYFVEELSFQVRQDYDPVSENLPRLSSSDLEIEVRLGEIEEDAFKKMCHLTVSLKAKAQKAFPYNFKLAMVGFFQMDSSCTEDLIEVLLKNSAPSMLFTAGREILLLVTGRARFQPLMLPTMAFLPKVKTIKTDSQKALKPKAESKRTTSPKATKTKNKKVFNV